ncbi:MAG: hypothetical protein AAGA96_15510 [Verrucomicrobiota bacterium]
MEVISQQRETNRLRMRIPRIIFSLVGISFAAASLYFSAKLGIHMARQGLPQDAAAAVDQAMQDLVKLGVTGEPIFLADSPAALRRFFAEYPSPDSRSAADLTDTGIRRLQSEVDAIAMESQADAVKIRIRSGAIAESEYWVHYSQLSQNVPFDPIISPIPGELIE